MFVLVLLASVPYTLGPGVEQSLVTLFSLVAMATWWNLLAGFAGLTSFGQQAYLGVGAYGLYVLALAGVDPFAAIPLAAALAGVVALPVSVAVLRLSGGQFAVATWVLAEIFRLAVTLSPGGDTGVSLPGISGYMPLLRQALVYWCALGLAAGSVLAVWLLARGRYGLAARAVSADPDAAAASGVRVARIRRVAYCLAAAGAGAVGALLFTHTLYVQPGSIFNVQYSVLMMFMVLTGGLGTVEGPVAGALIFFVLQQALSAHGPWYLVLLGAVGVAVTLFAPRGLWGHLGRPLFPIAHLRET
ncbi:branched-chain amino acid ABC transporter permease [Acrocarpospora phusangensis]|uniref:Branched-chain amino acid ABC transporter permease n=1 Tax=Acrocarpospora phusangensis TaxID=1070424 RepID=A0A919Q991_9ACTN|nr:branched-chain amino acid ABC transporter permease [Acrocarpospora phusangensis]